MGDMDYNNIDGKEFSQDLVSLTPWSHLLLQHHERRKTMVSIRSPGLEDGVQNQLQPIQGKQACLIARASAQLHASIQEL